MGEPLSCRPENCILSSDPTEPLPPYAFVPGGPWPHPISSPRGHSFGRTASKIELAERAERSSLAQFLRGVELFNAGYYWEAHEAGKRSGTRTAARVRSADVLKALIKLAAAGVKVREGQEHGVVPTPAARPSYLLPRGNKAAVISWGSISTSGPTPRPVAATASRRPRPARRASGARVRHSRSRSTAETSQASRPPSGSRGPGTGARRRRPGTASTPAMITAMTPCEPPSTKP